MTSESGLTNLEDAPFKVFNLSAMNAAEKAALRKRLKNELCQVISVVDDIEAQLNRMFSPKFSVTIDNEQLHLRNDCPVDIQSSSCDHTDRQAPYCHKRKAVDMDRQQTGNDGLSNAKQAVVDEKSESASVVTGAFKSERLQRPIKEKVEGQIMDVSMSKHCMIILNKLMSHQFSWVFNQPVDPVKLNIPDYFTIISKPMDLGTVKQKLKDKTYQDALDFAADVKLTFSNAMRYNPPGNDVHIMAKELNKIFSLKWKVLESKLRKEKPHASQKSNVRKAHSETPSSQIVSGKGAAGHRISLARNSLSSVDRQKLIKDLTELSKGTMPCQLRSFLKKFDFHQQNDGTFEFGINEFCEEALRELYQLVRNCMDQEQLEAQGLLNNYEQGSVRNLCAGSSNCQKLCVNSCSDCTCTNVNFDCNHLIDLRQSLSSGVDSERSSCDDDQKFPFHASHLSHIDVMAEDQEGNSTNDTNGAVQSEAQLSPSKALRAAMLKSRFADTILRAQQRKLLRNGEKGDPTKMQQEREQLKKQQREERRRLEAQVKAAKAAAQQRLAEEMRLQREREREAVRLALQKMEKTVDIDENGEVLKELEILGYPEPNQLIDLPHEMVVDLMDGFESQGAAGNPLEQLGLFMKKDDLDEEGDDWIVSSADVEEGEIGPT